MDTLKLGTYSDAPDSLEKGGSETRPFHSEACHACSSQRARTRGRRSLVKHPWILFGIVALTWLAFSYGKRAFSRPPGHLAGESVEFSLPPDGDLDQCVDNTNWTTYYDQPPWALGYPYGAETTFSLPLASDALYLISRGALQQGLVNIEQSTEVADTVDVRVRVAYHDDEALERATVCQIEKTDREHGVGIFTPPYPPHRPPHRPSHHHWPKDQLHFDVTLTLPAGNEGPLLIKKLETKMPNYGQTVADLQGSVLFDKISLMSANGRLSVQSVTSEVGEFSSLNGKIDGHFNARSSLDLHTANGRIESTVNLLHREGADPANFTAHTINGKIDAEISLTSEALTGGEFEVDAQTRNGKIELKFTDTPVDSVLRCRAETTVGPIEVELDSAFEGTYSLQNKLGKKVVFERDVEDPAGKGRHRVVSQDKGAGRVEGELKWVESDESSSGNEGYIILKALVASVELVV
ncbi:hypothetical protein J3R82DRAFT_1407 [Butyriboletus roseoflavus]|nr:hypothetical protein J3R82DRAFT_1407 [Butyriboletus roseoflavus]